MTSDDMERMNLMRLKHATVNALRGVVFATVALFATTALLLPVAAQAMNDIASDGWTRNNELNGIKIDQYRSQSGAVQLDLLAFPVTNKSAAGWIETFVQHATKPDRDRGLKVHVINDDEIGSTKGPMNTSSGNADIATRSVMVLRPDGENLMVSVRAIVRIGEPVQASFLTQKGSVSEVELEQASKIRYDARIPVNESAAFLGLESMVEVMTSGLIYPEGGKSNSVRHSAKPAGTQAPSRVSSKPAVAPVVRTAGSSKRAPLLVNIPGPRVKVSGKMLGGLPAGYRMHLTATNYWTNKSMTATRSLHMTLTNDGQFSKGTFSVSGSADGSVGTITSSDKHGSAGSVMGGTNPGQSHGASSVYLKTRKGVDPTKYGTYYISGDQLELRYANGETEKHSFQTNGYSTLVISNKKYFVSTPKGWDKFTGGKNTKYRSLDGSYIATVTRIKGSVPDGVAYLNDYIERGKSKGVIVSAGPITRMKTRRHGVVKSSMVFQIDGKRLERDVYVRHGSNSTVSRFVQVERYEGASGDNKILEFLGNL